MDGVVGEKEQEVTAGREDRGCDERGREIARRRGERKGSSVCWLL